MSVHPQHFSVSAHNRFFAILPFCQLCIIKEIDDDDDDDDDDFSASKVLLLF